MSQILKIIVTRRAVAAVPAATKRLAFFSTAPATPKGTILNKKKGEMFFHSNKEEPSFAVDAPDGTPDSSLITEMREIDEYIDFAAANEDTVGVAYRHKMEKVVRLEQARDPEHDW